MPEHVSSHNKKPKRTKKKSGKKRPTAFDKDPTSGGFTSKKRRKR